MLSTEAEWKDIANKTFQRWHFRNCFAADDGKHIQLMHPHNSGFWYINYNGFFSIVLMALADYDYKFLFADIGWKVRISDGSLFRNCDFYGALVWNELKLPLPTEVPPLNPGWNSTEPVPFVFVGDDAFPLTNFCMKSYPLTVLTEEERLFNFRLSHFRRISKNAFGIWSNTFCLFSTRICMQPEKTTSCALALIALHNLLGTKSRNSYTPPGFAGEADKDGRIHEGEWRKQMHIFNNLLPLPSTHSRRSTADAIGIRNSFKQYFCGAGSVPWQWKHLL